MRTPQETNRLLVLMLLLGSIAGVVLGVYARRHAVVIAIQPAVQKHGQDDANRSFDMMSRRNLDPMDSTNPFNPPR